MWLVLTEPYDETGPWLASGLRRHLAGPVVHLTTREVTQDARTVRGADQGEAWFRIELADATVIDSRELRGVVNRVCALPPGLAFRLQSPQRDYAEQNFGLPLLQLLHGFAGPVLNRPTLQGISGDFRLDFEWAALAAQVGFLRAGMRPHWSNPAPNSHWNLREKPATSLHVAVVGDQVVPLCATALTMPLAAISCCRRLAALSRSTLLGLELTRHPANEWQFVRANLRPNLVPGGEGVLAAIADALAAPATDTTPTRPPGRTGQTTEALA